MQQNKKFLLVAREWLELKKMSVKYSSYVKYETVILKHVVPFFDNYILYNDSCGWFVPVQ